VNLCAAGDGGFPAAARGVGVRCPPVVGLTCVAGDGGGVRQLGPGDEVGGQDGGVGQGQWGSGRDCRQVRPAQREGRGGPGARPAVGDRGHGRAAGELGRQRVADCGVGGWFQASVGEVESVGHGAAVADQDVGGAGRVLCPAVDLGHTLEQGQGRAGQLVGGLGPQRDRVAGGVLAGQFHEVVDQVEAVAAARVGRGRDREVHGEHLTGSDVQVPVQRVAQRPHDLTGRGRRAGDRGRVDRGGRAAQGDRRARHVGRVGGQDVGDDHVLGVQPGREVDLELEADRVALLICRFGRGGDIGEGAAVHRAGPGRGGGDALDHARFGGRLPGL
jgi:hypothetical protein